MGSRQQLCAGGPGGCDGGVLEVLRIRGNVCGELAPRKLNESRAAAKSCDRLCQARSLGRPCVSIWETSPHLRFISNLGSLRPVLVWNTRNGRFVLLTPQTH